MPRSSNSILAVLGSTSTSYDGGSCIFCPIIHTQVSLSRSLKLSTTYTFPYQIRAIKSYILIICLWSI
jgi:hypothetical protein